MVAKKKLPTSQWNRLQVYNFQYLSTLLRSQRQTFSKIPGSEILKHYFEQRLLRLKTITECLLSSFCSKKKDIQK